MGWHYQLVRYDDGIADDGVIMLHEMYEFSDGPMVTDDPIRFGSHDVEDIIGGLEQAIKDIRKYGIVNKSDFEHECED